MSRFLTSSKSSQTFETHGLGDAGVLAVREQDQRREGLVPSTEEMTEIGVVEGWPGYRTTMEGGTCT